MISLVVKTPESPQKVIEMAIRYFGPSGLNMTIEEQNPESILFVKGDGNVEIVARKEEKTTSVEIVSREWEYQATEFIRKILPHVRQQTPLLWTGLALIVIGIISAVVAWFVYGKVTGVVIGVIIAFIGVALNNIAGQRNR
jgi:hypothetical protein